MEKILIALIYRALLAEPMQQISKKSEAVLEGKFNIAIYKAYASNVPHPFQLDDLKLRPHDGCGFIKQTLADQLGIDPTALNHNQHSCSYLPAQALQHYTTMESGSNTLENFEKELCKKLKDEINNLDSLDESKCGGRLFRLLTSGGIKGRSFVALPSSDAKVYGSHLSSALLLGRAPYDQANLLPIERSDSSNPLNNKGYVIQYSLVVQDIEVDAMSAQSNDLHSASPIWFAKGLLVAIPDEKWPSDLNGIDIVLSSDDIKTHSKWKNIKEKDDFKNEDRKLTVGGILAAIDAYGPSDCIAVPIHHQSYLSGDFDGDKVLVIDGEKDYPFLYQLVKMHQLSNGSKDAARFHKPKKTFTSAWKNEKYYFGRSQEISVTKKQVLECFSTLQARFLTTKEEIRKDIQQKVCYMINEDPDLRKNFPSTQEQDLNMLLSMGIKVGTDAYKSATDIQAYAQLARKLVSIFDKEDIGKCVPYGKALARAMGNKKLGIDKLKDILERNPTLAARCMRISLDILKEKDLLKPYLNIDAEESLKDVA